MNDETKLYSIKKDSKGDVYHITFSKELESDSSNYQEIIETLRDAFEEDEIYIYLDCNGGDTNTSGVISNAIKNCKATVNVVVTGRSYSASCDIALSGDSLTLNPYTFLMFHNYSTSIEGKGNELITRLKNEHRVEESMIKNLYYPFLTSKEIDAILNDKDIYIHWDDKNLKDRIIRHFGDTKDA